MGVALILGTRASFWSRRFEFLKMGAKKFLARQLTHFI